MFILNMNDAFNKIESFHVIFIGYYWDITQRNIYYLSCTFDKKVCMQFANGVMALKRYKEYLIQGHRSLQRSCTFASFLKYILTEFRLFC